MERRMLIRFYEMSKITSENFVRPWFMSVGAYSCTRRRSSDRTKRGSGRSIRTTIIASRISPIFRQADYYDRAETIDASGSRRIDRSCPEPGIFYVDYCIFRAAGPLISRQWYIFTEVLISSVAKRICGGAVQRLRCIQRHQEGVIFASHELLKNRWKKKREKRKQKKKKIRNLTLRVPFEHR